MDSDLISVDTEAVNIINKAKSEGRRICAVGTSVQRVLETATLTNGMLKEYDGWTSKFIFPDYQFQVANSMIANFYMPYSTMLMLTAAFGGYEYVMNAYNVALKEGYRFGLYGDAMLIID
jgi:S-adenosylmethionine:tRNA ribosyltransferase-isomerase